MASSKTVINKLVDTQNVLKQLAPAQVLTPIEASRGVGSAPIGNPSGRGYSAVDISQLAETSFADRTFWPNRNVASSDGIFTMVIKPIQQMKFDIGNGRFVIMTLVDPGSAP